MTRQRLRARRPPHAVAAVSMHPATSARSSEWGQNGVRGSAGGLKNESPMRFRTRGHADSALIATVQETS